MRVDGKVEEGARLELYECKLGLEIYGGFGMGLREYYGADHFSTSA